MGSRNRYSKRIPRYNPYGIEQRPPTWDEKFRETHFSEDSDTILSRIAPGFKEGARERAQALRKKEDEAFWNNFWHGNPEGIPGPKVKGRRQILREERDQAIQSQSPKIKNIPQSQLTDQQKINQDLYGTTPSNFVNPLPNAGNEKLWGTSNEPGREGQYLTSDGQVLQLQAPAVQDSEKIDKASVEVVDKSDDTKTVVENQEKAQSKDAPGSDADLEKERQANLDEQISAGLKERETTFGPEGTETEIKDVPQDKTKQPDPNAAQKNFDKIAGAIHGLATIAKALDTGEFTPPRTPSSWESVKSKTAEVSTEDSTPNVPPPSTETKSISTSIPDLVSYDPDKKKRLGWRMIS